MNRPSRLADLPPPPSGRTGWPWTEETPPAAYAGRDAWPRISLVTPSYQQADFLEETIRSILLQNYPDLQYLIIDGGSTDGSREIIARYSPWLDHWESERDRGQSHALNKGLARCDGAWCNWINSDDRLEPGALAALAAAAAVTDAPIVAGITRNLRDGAPAESYGSRLGAGFPAGLFSLGVNQPGSLLRLAPPAERSVRESLHYTMDLDLWLRLLLRHGRAGITAIPQEVAVYRYHASSKTCSAADVFALEEFAVLHDLFASLAPGGTLPGLADIRALCAAAPAELAPPRPAAEHPALALAFLDRLLVSDSLLFRALRRHFGDTAETGARLLQVLDRLRPALAAAYPHDHGRRESRALVHALEERGRLDGALAWRALRAAPSPATARALLRLWLFPRPAPS